ncbi:response regulator transcription factor [Caulobacter soli]|uniref:response regulator transcription factor n=1 Tax=Caulobacter soli TaxID=2708539 RepID=UPI0013ED75E6|nr:response regulator transcription factor [Caulobacter soli]
MRVGVVESDPSWARLVADTLSESGHFCHLFDNGRDFVRHLSWNAFDLTIIDIDFSGVPGLDLIDWVRHEARSWVLVLALTESSTETEVSAILDVGADDVMCKPFTTKAMMSRVNAMTRRMNSSISNDDEIYDGFRFIKSTESIIRNGVEFNLTSKEFHLALTMFKRMSQPLSRAFLLESVWGRDPNLPTRTLDAHISRIRQKLALTPERGYRISPVYSLGYRLDAVRVGNEYPI